MSAAADRPTRRATFIRREMSKALQQARFNRRHYSSAEAVCWDFAAADCLNALGGIAGDWRRAVGESAGKATGSAS